VTEEVWHHLPGTEGSIHGTEWPTLEFEDETAERSGALVADVASTIRAWKSDAGMALNAELEKIEVYPEDDHDEAIDTYDLSETVNGPVYVREGIPSVELVPVEVDPDHSQIGPTFRDRAGEVVAALEAADPAEIAAGKSAGEIELELDDETVTVEGDAVTVREEHRAEGGEEVEVLEGDRATILVFP
jgi:valyl-tRNA synthetase